MKTRTALVYLSIFLLLAAYFYYFEVVRPRSHEKHMEAARRLFQVEKSDISALKLKRAETNLVSLEKNDGWRVVEPLPARADELAVDRLLSGLHSLEIERQVVAETSDLQSYGLDTPSLHLSFRAAGSWHQLRIGARAPVGDQFYSSGDEEGRVLLIAGSSQESFDKTLFDLRSKELFTLKTEEIDRIEIAHPNNSLILTRLDEGHWQAPAAPDVKLKNSKVESLLNRLSRLQAQRFLRPEQEDAAAPGLEPGRIRVQLSTQDEKETLLIGHAKKDEGAYAKNLDLPEIAVISEDLVEALPKELTDLEDRAVLVFESEQVMALTLELEGKAARLERHDEAWKWIADGRREDPETWEVNSLLWKLQNLEYQVGTPPEQQSPPEQRRLRLALFAEDELQIGALRLDEIPAAKQEQALFWFSEGDKPPRLYWGSSEALRGLHQSLTNVLSPSPES